MATKTKLTKEEQREEAQEQEAAQALEELSRQALAEEKQDAADATADAQEQPKATKKTGKDAIKHPGQIKGGRAKKAKVIREHRLADARAAKARVSSTGVTPSLSSMKIGTRLHRIYHGKRIEAEVVAGEGGAHLLLVKGHKTPASSLPAGATLISNHAERGALVWRTPNGKNLLPGGTAPHYGAMAATPAPKRPKAAKKTGLQRMAEREAAKAAARAKAKPRAGNGEAGSMRTRKAIKCGQKGCTEIFANTADASKHLIDAHPAS